MRTESEFTKTCKKNETSFRAQDAPVERVRSRGTLCLSSNGETQGVSTSPRLAGASLNMTSRLAIVCLLVALACASLAAQTAVPNNSAKAQPQEHSKRRIVLPNPQMLRCVTSECLALLAKQTGSENDIYPVQVSVDFYDGKPCPLGITAVYPKSVSFEELRDALDEQYAKWSVLSDKRSKLWRVESEQIGIQLEELNESDAKALMAEVGTKQLIFLPFTRTCGGSASSHVAE